MTEAADTNDLLEQVRKQIAEWNMADRWDKASTRNEYRLFAGAQLTEWVEKLDKALSAGEPLPTA